MVDLRGLPGAALVDEGIDDLRNGKDTPAALAVSCARTRLRQLGLEIPDLGLTVPYELELYRALGRAGVDDPYARYNAMLRELSSFLEALEGRRRRSLSASAD